MVPGPGRIFAFTARFPEQQGTISSVSNEPSNQTTAKQEAVLGKKVAEKLLTTSFLPNQLGGSKSRKKKVTTTFFSYQQIASEKFKSILFSIDRTVGGSKSREKLANTFFSYKILTNSIRKIQVHLFFH